MRKKKTGRRAKRFGRKLTRLIGNGAITRWQRSFKGGRRTQAKGHGRYYKQR